MNTEQLSIYIKSIQAHADKGTEIVASIKAAAAEKFGELLKVTRGDQHSLHMTFFGLRLIYRIEIGFPSETVAGCLCAYAVSYEEKPEETSIKCYSFDTLGNVDGRWHPRECGFNILAETLTGVIKTGKVLRP